MGDDVIEEDGEGDTSSGLGDWDIAGEGDGEGVLDAALEFR